MNNDHASNEIASIAVVLALASAGIFAGVYYLALGWIVAKSEDGPNVLWLFVVPATACGVAAFYVLRTHAMSSAVRATVVGVGATVIPSLVLWLLQYFWLMWAVASKTA